MREAIRDLVLRHPDQFRVVRDLLERSDAEALQEIRDNTFPHSGSATLRHNETVRSWFRSAFGPDEPDPFKKE